MLRGCTLDLRERHFDDALEQLIEALMALPFAEECATPVGSNLPMHAVSRAEAMLQEFIATLHDSPAWRLKVGREGRAPPEVLRIIITRQHMYLT